MAAVKSVHEKYMGEALKQAKKAFALGEVPIGCVIVHQGKIIGRGYNRRNTDKNTLAHAEITASKRPASTLETGAWRNAPFTLPWNPARCAQEPSFRPAFRRWLWAV